MNPNIQTSDLGCVTSIALITKTSHIFVVGIYLKGAFSTIIWLLSSSANAQNVNFKQPLANVVC